MMPPLPRESATAILIVDDDLGFLVWLGLTLASGGFATVPATTASQAGEVIHQLRITINLAVVNLNLPGVPEFCASLKSQTPSIKLIAIQELGPNSMFNVDARHSRSKVGWVTLVRRLLGIEKGTGAR
jgi:DNA-binding NtrC family response regulator